MPATSRPGKGTSPFVGLALALGALGLVALLAVLLGRDAQPPRAVRTITAVSPPATAPIGTPAASPSPAAREQVVVRSLAGGCIPVPGAAACDVLRAGLWSGDLEAWRQWAAVQGSSPPTAAEAQAGTIALRLSAGDPAARIDFARATGQPLVLVTRVHLRGTDERRQVVAVEIGNLGAAPALLGGLQIAGGEPLAGGGSLAPGARCELGPEARTPCPGLPASGPALPLPPGGVVRLLAADGRALDEVIIL